MIGRTLGDRYELIEVVGVGGMAVVYKAKDKLLNRLVAVKVLKSEFNDNEQFIRKFKRESQAAASLSHNNIVNVFDVGVEGNDHYIVMEYVKGKTLKAYIKEKGRLPWKEALYITKQIAFALDHAHKNKIIHRDIKPHNIILNEDMVPKVTDFGIARAISSATITLVEETMGSVHYISPEQARGGFVDEKSDLYSLGIVLYEMLTGSVPFDSDNSVSVAIKHIQEDLIVPDEIQDVPQGLIDIVYRLVKKNPVNRYNSARDLIKDLILVQNNPSVRIESIDADDAATKKTPIIEESQLNKKDLGQKISDTRKKIGKKSIIAIVLISVILGAVAFAISNVLEVKEIEVPDVTGKHVDEAVEVLDSNNLQYEIKRQSSSDVKVDYVIKQDPVGKSLIKEGQTVTLFVSDGPKMVEVPNVVDSYEIEGVQTLENMGFVVDEIIREYNDEYEKDVIYDQYPKAGTTLEVGSSIKLYVSKGKNTVVIDNLVGMNVEDAKNVLLSLGLVVGDIEEETSEEYDKDIVIAQNPAAGEEVDKDSVVNLTVSKGLIKTKSITVDLSQYVDDSYFEDNESGENKVNVQVRLIDQDNTSTLVYSQDHFVDEVISVELKGVGTQYYQIQIDDTVYEPQIINF